MLFVLYVIMISNIYINEYINININININIDMGINIKTDSIKIKMK